MSSAREARGTATGFPAAKRPKAKATGRRMQEEFARDTAAAVQENPCIGGTHRTSHWPNGGLPATGASAGQAALGLSLVLLTAVMG